MEIAIAVILGCLGFVAGSAKCYEDGKIQPIGWILASLIVLATALSAYMSSQQERIADQIRKQLLVFFFFYSELSSWKGNATLELDVFAMNNKFYLESASRKLFEANDAENPTVRQKAIGRLYASLWSYKSFIASNWDILRARLDGLGIAKDSEHLKDAQAVFDGIDWDMDSNAAKQASLIDAENRFNDLKSSALHAEFMTFRAIETQYKKRICGIPRDTPSNYCSQED